MRAHLARILGSRWTTRVVADGQSALQFARDHRPDLLVTDVMMPTLDGVELVTAVRADPGLATLPVIMLSARAGTEAAGEGLAAGADDYVVKPFTAKDLVGRVAARLDIAARDRSDRERRETSSERRTALAELAAELSTAASVQDALATLLASPVGSLGARSAALGLLDGERGLVRIAFDGEFQAEFRDRYHVVALDAPVPMSEVVRTGRALVIPDTSELDEPYEAVVRDAAPTARAAVIEPLRGADGAVLGALALTWPEPHELEPAEIEIAGQVAAMVAPAVARIETREREHRIATELQERLLGLEVRSRGAVVSAVYQPAEELMRVGGDWYTATTLEDSARIAVSVGDVVGHGLRGATVMSQLRSALGAAALATEDPSGVVDLLERYAMHVAGAECATVAYAVIDTDAGTVRYSCAGHPFPLLVAEDGSARYLRDGRRPPLASRAGVSPGRTGCSELPVGSLLLLYTDGLVERRGESLGASLDRLAAAAAGCARLAAGEVCRELLGRMAPVGGYSDDAAVVVARPVGSTPHSFVEAVPADPSSAAPLRHRLRAWLQGSCAQRFARPLVHDVLLGVGEAVNNAAEHGSGFDARRIVTVEVFADGEGVSASVSDSGRWTSDSAASRRESRRGRGLTLIHGLSDHVTIDRTMLGTRVTMRYDVKPQTRTGR